MLWRYLCQQNPSNLSGYLVKLNVHASSIDKLVSLARVGFDPCFVTFPTCRTKKPVKVEKLFIVSGSESVTQSPRSRLPGFKYTPCIRYSRAHLVYHLTKVPPTHALNLELKTAFCTFSLE